MGWGSIRVSRSHGSKNGTGRPADPKDDQLGLGDFRKQPAEQKCGLAASSMNCVGTFVFSGKDFLKCRGGSLFTGPRANKWRRSGGGENRGFFINRWGRSCTLTPPAKRKRLERGPGRGGYRRGLLRWRSKSRPWERFET